MVEYSGHPCIECGVELVLVQQEKSKGAPKAKKLTCPNCECSQYGGIVKPCLKCVDVLPETVDYFHKNPTTKDGFHSYCITCHKAINAINAVRWQKENPQKQVIHQKNHRAKYPEKFREINRIAQVKYVKRYPEKHAIKEQRRRARRNNLVNDFTLDQWNAALNYFNGTCAYCGRQQTFWHVLEQEHVIPVVNGGGYTANNIVPACNFCNSSKNDRPLMDWLNWKFGKRKAAQIFERIQIYFVSVREATV